MKKCIDLPILDDSNEVLECQEIFPPPGYSPLHEQDDGQIINILKNRPRLIYMLKDVEIIPSSEPSLFQIFRINNNYILYEGENYLFKSSNLDVVKRNKKEWEHAYLCDLNEDINELPFNQRKIEPFRIKKYRWGRKNICDVTFYFDFKENRWQFIADFCDRCENRVKKIQDEIYTLGDLRKIEWRLLNEMICNIFSKHGFVY